MCGIVGFIDKKSNTDVKRREKIVREMLDLISHRGGDATGVVTYDNITIGHTRLAIVDVTHNADQPYESEEYILSYNGEIYNHDVLRNQYCVDRKIQSPSDTATLFALLHTLPIEDILRMIDGMYAFSVLDVKNRAVFLALDKMAIKPLYYVDTSEYFAWASEIKAFKALPGFVFRMNRDVLFEHMVFRYIFGKPTLLENVFKIPSGTYLNYSLDSGTFFAKKYFELTKGDSSNENTEEVLRESVKGSLMSDEPVGVQLSGGIDSSLVSYFAQKISSNPIHSFSIGLRNDEWNEFEYSDAISQELGTIHHKILFTKEDFVNFFEKITYHLDEPIVHSNTVPMYLLAKHARQYTKVLITGEGADEVFLGYRRYLKKDIICDEELLYSNAFSSPDTVLSVLKNKSQLLSERKLLVQKVSDLDWQDKLSHYDMLTYLPHVLLRQDKAGMAANVENRVPFLANSMVEVGYNSSLKIGEFGGKTPLKRLALKYFPQDFVLRKKCGFGLPISDWLKDDNCLLPHLNALKRSQLISEHFNEENINKMIGEHLDGVNDHSIMLFSLVGLDTWHRIFCSTNE